MFACAPDADQLDQLFQGVPVDREELEDTPEPSPSDDPQQDAKESGSGEDQDSRTLFVGNVPVQTRDKTLKKLFTVFGPVQSVRFRSVATTSTMPKKYAISEKKFAEHCKSKNAYVVFAKAESVQRAIAEGRQLEIEEHRLRLDRVGPKQEDSKDRDLRSVFVGNIVFTAEEDDLRKFFESCGEIESVRLIRDRQTRLGKGFGYVTFSDKKSVKNALAFNGTFFSEREIRVKRCKNPVLTLQKKQVVRVVTKPKDKKLKKKPKKLVPKKSKKSVVSSPDRLKGLSKLKRLKQLQRLQSK